MFTLELSMTSSRHGALSKAVQSGGIENDYSGTTGGSVNHWGSEVNEYCVAGSHVFFVFFLTVVGLRAHLWNILHMLWYSLQLRHKAY